MIAILGWAFAGILSILVVLLGRAGSEEGGALGRLVEMRLPILEIGREDIVRLCENGLVLGDS